ncbi:MAG: D-alanine--D-alanine ligase [Planctomycetota bacterium]
MIQTNSRAREEVGRATIAVLCGGRSSEREISLRSGEAVLRALREPESSADSRGPARCIRVEIDESGGWIVEGVRRSAAAAVESLPEETIYFLGLHGGEGENGAVQGMLETCARRYTGSGVGASALCMDKHATRLVLGGIGIAVAEAKLLDRAEWNAGRERHLRDILALSDDGWVVKPNCGGSSVATSVVLRGEDLPGAIEKALATGDRALVERRILGTEATCAVLGNAGDALEALMPVEILPHAGRFFDWEEKYSASGAEENCPPRTITPTMCARLRELSIRVHAAAGCDGYSRTDFIVPADGGEPVALEINTLPGLTSRSLVPKAAAEASLSFRDLCLLILALAVQKRAVPEARVR